MVAGAKAIFFLFLPNAFGTASATNFRRSSRTNELYALTASNRRQDSVADCSCECCIVQVSLAGFLSCAPRVGGAAVALGAVSGGCDATCSVPDGDKQRFGALSRQVDYARYCPSTCTSSGAEGVPEEALRGETVLCAVPGSREASPQGLGLLSGKSSKVTAAASTVVQENTGGNQDVSDAVLALAKFRMEEAKEHAEVAEQNAQKAKQAYESIVSSAERIGKKAAQRTLDQIRGQAAQQSLDVLRARRRYEDGARENARKAGFSAAQVYLRAKQRDLDIARQWFLRSNQFRAASVAEDKAAVESAAEAQGYRDANDPEGTREYFLRATAAMDAARLYGKEAAVAEKQAEAIASGARWYDLAAPAASAAAAARALPKDVFAFPATIPGSVPMASSPSHIDPSMPSMPGTMPRSMTYPPTPQIDPSSPSIPGAMPMNPAWTPLQPQSPIPAASPPAPLWTTPQGNPPMPQGTNRALAYPQPQQGLPIAPSRNFPVPPPGAAQQVAQFPVPPPLPASAQTSAQVLPFTAPVPLRPEPPRMPSMPELPAPPPPLPVVPAPLPQAPPPAM